MTITYNQERYIGQCIESVLAQTYTNWQLLIVDDGSDDGTCEKIKFYTDNRIALISAPHRGIGKLKESYDLAVEQANGQLLAILDGDDWWPTNKLEVEVAAFENPEVVMAFGNVGIYDENSRFVEFGRLPNFSKGLCEGNGIIHQILTSGYFPFSVTSIVRKSAICAIDGFVQPAGLPLVDLPTWLNILPDAKCFGIPEVLGCYRVHDESVCRKRSSVIARGQMDFNEIFLDANWNRIGLTEKAWCKYRKELFAYNSNRRGVLYMLENNWSESLQHFKHSFHNGNVLRKMKTVMRIIQLIWKKHLDRRWNEN